MHGTGEGAPFASAGSIAIEHASWMLAPNRAT
jgi:hypothetical protein